ncbi:ATP-binding protein [Rhodoferax sp.]|uniref:hybrid sensor histidine kinase/response regulator n=1 Tax=Rhodoferax sp. TaxID=50421 RepID=UPI0026183257|nr:ATP-binding protein [Rhodoferax sp.]MDD2919602.1 ATP-binding protein [Rhodoferax sp.]
MKTLDIRKRMLLAALLPVMLLGLLLSGVFLMNRFEDINDSYQTRTSAVARQLALASEFGLFAANQLQLQTIARGALREPDLRWVGILDREGRLQASAGDAGSAGVPTVTNLAAQILGDQEALHVIQQTVYANGLKLDDVYEDSNNANSAQAAPLGQVVVKFSRQSVTKKKNDILLLGGLISALGILFGAVLAVRLSAGVIRPTMRVSNLIERIGHGDFAAAARVQRFTPVHDPLYGMQENLMRMSDRLAHVQQDLEKKVATVTQALREKKEDAEQATQAKSRFLAAASHDLRQPIHALGMFVARLAQLSHDGPTRHLIGNLEASVRALQNLLDGLLDISRLESKAVQIRLQQFPLMDLFDRLDQDLAPIALDKGLRLHIRPCPVWVQSDPVLLYRILLNLMGNALRYTEKGGVVVACRRTSSATLVNIEVWDSGLGIAPEHQQAVFKEFYQVGNPERQSGKGLGLGLNIVQRSCQLLHHPLQLASRLGVGTRLRLTLPMAARPTAQALSTLAEAPQEQGGQGCTVLVVEDDDLAREALVGLLQSWGYQAAQANGLNDAKQVLQNGFVPELIISDYRLDGATHGMEVIVQLRRQLARQVPACLISADTDPELLQTAQAAQLTLLHKPVRPAKLRSLMNRLLAVQGLRDES